MQADLEEQHQHAQLAQRVQHLAARIEDAEHRCAEQHAREQLAEHGRLPHPLGELASSLVATSSATRAPRT
jgi:hypothetical protein